jgi:hypothetical protein
MHRLLRTISANRLDIMGFLLACLAGALFLWLITPTGFIRGWSSYWQNQLEDVAQYLSGYRAYLSAPWSFPLLEIPSLNWPHGTTLTFVDAIPTYSLLLKLIQPMVPLPDNTLGVWVLICYALQGGAAWFLARQVAGSNYLLVGFVVILCILMPSLTARMGHISLQAHFIILFALGLYFRARTKDRPQVFPWTALIIFSFYTNFYLTAMALAILMASVADRALVTRRWSESLALGVPVIVLVLSIPVMLGTAFGSAVADTGFGFYSMNLLSPVAYGYLLQLPFFVQGTGGQYEGYNYLGLGLILLLAFAVWDRRRKGATVTGFGPGLVIILALLTVYSLSNEIYLSDIHLLSWDVPGSLWNIFQSFRSSGRFFWPVSYALVIFAVIRLGGQGKALQACAVCAVLILQVTDLAPTYASIAQSLDRPANKPADMQAWDAALTGVATIHAFPKFKCPGGYAREVLPLQAVAAEGGYNLTTGFISRYGADCDAIAEEIASSDQATSAYVFANTHFPADRIKSYLPQDARCEKLDIWSVCRIPIETEK